MEKNGNFGTKKKLGLVIAVLIIGYLGFIIFANDKELSPAEINTPVTSSIDYVIAGKDKQPATYYPAKTLDLFIGDENIDDNFDGKPDYQAVEVGEKGLEAGTYTIEQVEEDDYCSLKVRDKDSQDVFAGEEHFQGDVITLTSSDELTGYNCNMHDGGLNIQLAQEKELKTPEVAEVLEQSGTLEFSITKELFEQEHNLETGLVVFDQNQGTEIPFAQIENYLSQEQIKEVKNDLEQQIVAKGWN